MMKHISLLYLIFNLLAGNALHAQTASQTYDEAVADVRAEKYADALSKFERIRYFRPDTLQMEIFLQTGNCLLFTGDYYNAVKYFDNALLADLHHLHQNEIQIQKLKAYVVANNMRLAKICLSDIDTLHDALAKSEVIFYTGVMHFYLEEYDKAQTDWLKLVKNDTQKRQKIIGLFRKNRKVNRLKPGIAIALSIVLPGAGQIYAGDVKEGLNSLLLNGAFFLLGYNTAVVYNIYNALIAVGPWYIRYYQGGFLRAGEIVMAKRAQRHQAIYLQLLEVMGSH
jgi:tetratricopeptide (TPR) repeat protein